MALNISYLNFYMSALRNMFLTSSIAIAMVGFSDKFENVNKLLIKIISYGVIIISIGFGLKSTANFKLMIEKNLQMKNLSPVEIELIRQSQEWPLYAYTYILFLSIIFFAKITRELRIIKK